MEFMESSREIILSLHLLTLLFIIWNIFWADKLALAWVRGVVSVTDEKKIARYHRRIWIGLALMIATGLALFWKDRDILPLLSAFRIKMFFVGVLLINGLVIGKLSRIAAQKPFASLSPKEKLPLFISGAISLISWLGAFTAAFFLFE